MADNSLYQYLNNGQIIFDGSWKYNQKTFPEIKEQFTKLMGELSATEVEFIADVVMDTDWLDRLLSDESPYIVTIYQSAMNMWLHYTLGQVFNLLMKKHQPDALTLIGMTHKEATKFIKQKEREMLAEYTEYEKEWL